MAQMSVVEALNQAIMEEMQRDERSSVSEKISAMRTADMVERLQ